VQRNLCPMRISKGGNRGPLLGRYGHKGTSSAKAQKATGDPCLGARAQGQQCKQLMPGAHQQRSVRGRYGHKGNRGGKSAMQLMPGAQQQLSVRGRYGHNLCSFFLCVAYATSTGSLSTFALA
jgi:hypothetical protein